MMESKESKESMENVEEAQAVQDARAVIERIERVFTEREHVFVAIDGPCASGKTTLAALLQRRFDGNVLHMDDFFLRPEQRTPERSPNREQCRSGTIRRRGAGSARCRKYRAVSSLGLPYRRFCGFA